MTDTIRDGEKVTRETFPTAAFTLKKSHIRWIARAAKAAGISKSEFVRNLFDRAMDDEREGREAA